MKLAKTSGTALAATAAALMMSGTITTTAQAHEGDVACYGVTACKGHSACKTAGNACKGQNACKGHGFIKMSKEQCEAIGGSLTEKKEEKK